MTPKLPWSQVSDRVPLLSRLIREGILDSRSVPVLLPWSPVSDRVLLLSRLIREGLLDTSSVQSTDGRDIHELGGASPRPAQIWGPAK